MKVNIYTVYILINLVNFIVFYNTDPPPDIPNFF